VPFGCPHTDRQLGGGGGAYGSTLYNCIVCLNTAPNGANYDLSSTLNYSCTTSLPAGAGNITGVSLVWTSVTNRTYSVERAADPVSLPAFSLLQTNIPGLPDTTSFTDTNPPPAGSAYYRVGVHQ
jgi:hypothetical protein